MTKKKRKRKKKWDTPVSVVCPACELAPLAVWARRGGRTGENLPGPRAEGLVRHGTLPTSAQGRRWPGLKKAPFYLFLGRKEGGCDIFRSGWQLKVCLVKLLFDKRIASLEEK